MFFCLKTEEVVEEEEDGELLKTGIRFTGMPGEDLKLVYIDLSNSLHEDTLLLLVFW